MNLTKTSLFALVLAFCLSCGDNGTWFPPFCAKYVDGDVAVGTKDSVDLADMFAIFNEDQASIYQVFYLYYDSNIPGDSATAVINYLNAKSYIGVPSWGATPNTVYPSPETGTLKVQVPLWNMTIENQADWLATVAALKLREQLSGKSVLLKVQFGTEKSLVMKYRANPKVRYAELNCYGLAIPNF